MKLFTKKNFKRLFYLSMAGGVAGMLLVIGVVVYFAQQVPDFRTIAEYQPPQVTKIYADDGQLIAEYAKEKRVYVPIEEIPVPVIQAYLAAEDSHFYQHGGFDLKGIIRAALTNLLTSRRQGASTITQQLVKGLLLTNERTYTRKIKEVILAYRIEKFLTKEEILELYLNQIYLGAGSYGVAAAALTYFNKPLDELSIGQRAMLAGLPKAPSAYNPLRKPKAARFRRDVVLGRMLAEGFITQEEFEQEKEKDLELNPREKKYGQEAPYFSEHVRRLISEKYGDDRLYKGGLKVHTTLDMTLQKHAQEALKAGLRAYTRRHGYKGPIGRVAFEGTWKARLKEAQKEYEWLGDFAKVAYVTSASKEEAEIKFIDETTGKIPLVAVRWARKYIDADTKGDRIYAVDQVVSVGDVVLVNALDNVPGYEKLPSREGLYTLEQVPSVQGALVAVDVNTGAVKAMVGGFEEGAHFNRAVQALRQPGSSFKPFVYAAALNRNYTPASIILDAPLVLSSPQDEKAWKPQNYSTKVYGPTPLRKGVEKSRNLMTIRLTQALGIRNVIDFAKRFGFESEFEPVLSTVLGSSSVNVLELVNAYAVFPNQGVYNPHFFIDRVQDPTGTLIERAAHFCKDCASVEVNPRIPPETDEFYAQRRVISEALAYQMTDILKGTVERGTGYRAKAVGRPVGIKTGTTNDFKDAWYVGFSPNLAVAVWVGFDTPVTLGKGETGSKAAGPIWVDFMKAAMADKAHLNFKIPEGIELIRIDADTGTRPNKNSKTVILEAFLKGTKPNEASDIQVEQKTEPSLLITEDPETGDVIQQEKPVNLLDLNEQGIY